MRSGKGFQHTGVVERVFNAHAVTFHKIGEGLCCHVPPPTLDVMNKVDARYIVVFCDPHTVCPLDNSQVDLDIRGDLADLIIPPFRIRLPVKKQSVIRL
jgi:hypothetical protein